VTSLKSISAGRESQNRVLAVAVEEAGN